MGRVVLSTEPVLYNANRNAGWTREAIDQALLQSLSAQKLYSLPQGCIMMIPMATWTMWLAFTQEDRLLLAQDSNPHGRNHQRLRENFERAADFKTLDGRRMRRLSLPLPDPSLSSRPSVAGSYLNFIFLNGAVIVPTFSQSENDQAALALPNVFSGSSRPALTATCCCARQGSTLLESASTCIRLKSVPEEM